MDLRQLRYFVAIAEHGTITAAAGSLFITQPSLSQQIRVLERGLGVELLERGRDGVRLTAAGRELLPRARDLITAAEEAITATRRAGAAPPLRIGCFRGPWNTADVVDALSAVHPVTVQILGQDEVVAGLSTGTLDAALVYYADDLPLELPAGVRTRHIASEPILLALSSAHPLAEAGTIAWSELAEVEWVAMTPPCYQHSMLVHLCRTYGGFKPRIAKLGDGWDVKALIDEGHGVTVSFVTVAQTASRALRMLMPSPQRTVLYCWTDNTPASARSAHLADAAEQLYHRHAARYPRDWQHA